MPARQSRRRLLLDTIAQAFEPGVRYPERRVSLFLGAIHADYAALRRYLIDEEFLSRSDGLYWRSGGTEFPSPGREAPGVGPGQPAEMAGAAAGNEPASAACANLVPGVARRLKVRVLPPASMPRRGHELNRVRALPCGDQAAGSPWATSVSPALVLARALRTSRRTRSNSRRGHVQRAAARWPAGMPFRPGPWGCIPAGHAHTDGQ
jgi:hypothetical protein